MSEEELETLRYVDCSSSEIETVNKAVDTIEKLQKENKQLKGIIQKAINRISLIRMDNDTSIESHKLLNDVLNILQGKEDK